MKWQHFVAWAKGLGFDGDADEFATVSAWLESNDYNAKSVTSGGQDYDLRELFDARNGTAADLTDTVKAAEDEDRINKRVAEALDAAGFNKKAAKTDDTKAHVNVTVGKDRLADDPKGGFKTFGDFAMDVKSYATKGVAPEAIARWEKAAASTYANESSGADGGFAVVPSGFSGEIRAYTEGEESLIARCDRFPMSGPSISFPVDEVPVWDTTNGVQVNSAGEATAGTQSKPKLKEKRFTARKSQAIVPVTEELLEDATAMGAFITRRAGEKLDWNNGEWVMRGAGGDQPIGLLNSGALVTVAKETSQVADTIVGINVLKMWSRMYAPFRRNAVWLINQDIEPQLYTLMKVGKLDTGANDTGWGVPLYQQASGLSGSPYGTLMGRPVIPTQHCETLGDLGDIVLADLSQYAVADRSGVNATSSMHLWFDQGLTAFRFTQRWDGQPWSDTTISPRDGSNTMSAFVALAARA